MPITKRLYKYCRDDNRFSSQGLDHIFQSDKLLCEDGCKILWQTCVKCIEEINYLNEK